MKHAGKGRIHTFVSTSPIHLKFQMNKTEEQVLEIITDTVTRSRNLIDDVEWSAMDATRTPIEYLCRCVEAAIKCGATTINLPDTVGYATPDEYKSMFEQIRERVPNATRRSSRSTATTTWAWLLPTRWPVSPVVPARSNAPSTAWANGPAMLPWKRSSWRSAPAATSCPT